MTDDFINVEDHGEWLSFRYSDGGTSPSVQVNISREALEDHFDAVSGLGEMEKAYAQHQDTIHETVKARLAAGGVYSRDQPLKLRTGDF